MQRTDRLAAAMLVLAALAGCSPTKIVTAPAQAVGSATSTVVRAAAPVAAGAAVGVATANPAAGMAAGRATSNVVARPASADTTSPEAPETETPQ